MSPTLAIGLLVGFLGGAVLGWFALWLARDGEKDDGAALEPPTLVDQLAQSLERTSNRLTDLKVEMSDVKRQLRDMEQDHAWVRAQRDALLGVEDAGV